MGKRTIVLAACVLLVGAAAAQNKSNVNLVGTWKMNLEKSTNPTKSTSVLVKVTEDSSTAFKYIATGVDANGKPIHQPTVAQPMGSHTLLLAIQPRLLSPIQGTAISATRHGR